MTVLCFCPIMVRATVLTYTIKACFSSFRVFSVTQLFHPACRLLLAGGIFCWCVCHHHNIQ